jgi:hypothetical protein
MSEKRLWIAVLALSAAAAVMLPICGRLIVAQAQVQPQGKNKPEPVYDPYPPGILPSDLDSEIARVVRELDVVENRALVR